MKGLVFAQLFAMNFLHLIVNSGTITNQSGLSDILKNYEHSQVLPNYWMIKTNEAPSEFVNTVRTYFAADQYVLFQTDESVMTGGAVFPQSVRTLLAGKAA